MLRQLQSVLGRCNGPAYDVIVKKMLRAVEHLPLSPDDLHQHTSAHGSFADTLWTLGGHADFEVGTRIPSNHVRADIDYEPSHILLCLI